MAAGRERSVPAHAFASMDDFSPGHSALQLDAEVQNVVAVFILRVKAGRMVPFETPAAFGHVPTPFLNGRQTQFKRLRSVQLARSVASTQETNANVGRSDVHVRVSLEIFGRLWD